ncbi:hypothetical protein Tco_1066471 [Tanacetum coccineum]|uniref:Uncharacterized protein n=1 Tax=Tanacetum coccineum TaxID=301880 RepID=A0ABQ5HAZ2_9ASTR
MKVQEACSSKIYPPLPLHCFPLSFSPEEPTRKSKRVKRPAKKSTNAPTVGVVIRDTPLMSLSKKKEKVTVEKGKGIDLLSEVEFTEEAQYEEVRKKSLRDFHKTHPSVLLLLPKLLQVLQKSNLLSQIKELDDNNNDRDSSSESGDQESDSGDDNTQSNKEKGSDSEHETDKNETGFRSDQDENEKKVKDDEEEKYDELLKPLPSSTEDDDENQCLKEKSEVTALEKEVAERKKDDLLNTQVTDLVDEHLDSRLGSTRDEFMSYLSASIPARITEQVKIQLPQILPKEVSKFAPSVIKSLVTESLKHAVLAKESSQPKSTYEAAASLTKFELKKILIDKMDESLKTKESKSGSSKGTKSQSKSSRKYIQAEEPEFEVEVMQKHGYGYLREIEVRRTDNELHTFKEGDFLRLCINDIEDMLILRVEDLQLGDESYQKKINITKPETTRPGIRKKYPYTSYQDPQGFIYVYNQGRNRLMRSDKLYKFNDGTLTRLRTSLDDIITKNI